MTEKPPRQLIDPPVGPPIIYPWFDMAWQGPVLDANGRITKEIKGEAIGPFNTGRIEFEVWNHEVSATSLNFKMLCTGEAGYGYKGSKFHRVIPQFMLQGGDFTRGNGTGGRPAPWKENVGEKFADENFFHKHRREAGSLAMANSGQNTNGSQFYITTIYTGWLDGKHVVFGKVRDQASMMVVKAIEATGSTTGKVQYERPPTIVDCGVEPKY
ncbi:MAG: hypothetical protein Q9212_002267 [Teloschistes hypoglaucus]